MPRLLLIQMKRIPLCAFAAVILIIGGCSSNDITNPNQIVFPADSVSYARQVGPYLALACGTSGCHDGSPNTANGIDLTTWLGVRAINVVTPHDTTSPLVLVMKGQLLHTAPFPTPTANQIEGMAQWVREGASQN